MEVTHYSIVALFSAVYRSVGEGPFEDLGDCTRAWSLLER